MTRYYMLMPPNDTGTPIQPHPPTHNHLCSCGCQKPNGSWPLYQHARTHTRSHTHTYTHTHVRAHTRARTHTRTHARTHARAIRPTP